MVEPQHKRVKLPGGGKLLGVPDELPFSDLQQLHHQLCSKCLCSLQLHQILNTFNRCNLFFNARPAHYQIAQGIDGSLVYASLLTVFFEVALKQQSRGLVCTRISEVVMAGADNESDIISILFEFLAQDNRYVSYSAMRALVSLLLLVREPLADVLICRFIEIMLHSNNWLQLGHTFEALRRVIEWKDVDEHPLEAGEDTGPPAECRLMKLSLTDIYGSNGVKYMATKILNYNWDALVSRSLELLELHTLQREHVFVSFVSLWTALISVKNNLHFGNIKEFYKGVEYLVNPLLKHSTPLVVWEKILDLFNEVLCYGSTLALQEVVGEEPCQLAALVISAVRGRRLLEFVPCGQLAEDVYQTHTDQNRTSQLHCDFRQTQARTKLQTQEQLGHYSGVQIVQPSNSRSPPGMDIQSDQMLFHPRTPQSDQSNTLVGCHADPGHSVESGAQAVRQKDAGPDHSLAPSGCQSIPHLHASTGHHLLEPGGSRCCPDVEVAQRTEQLTLTRSGMHCDDAAGVSTVSPARHLLSHPCTRADNQRTCNFKSKHFVVKNDLDCSSVSQAFQCLEATRSYSRPEESERNMYCTDQEVLHEGSSHNDRGIVSNSNNSFHSSLISKHSINKCDGSTEGEQFEARTNRLADQVKKQISDLHIDRSLKTVTKAPAEFHAEQSTPLESELKSNSDRRQNYTVNNKDVANSASLLPSSTFTLPSFGERECPQNCSHQSLMNNGDMPDRFESGHGARGANYYSSAPAPNDSAQACQPRPPLPGAIGLHGAVNGSRGRSAGGPAVTEASSSDGSSNTASAAPSHKEQSINGLQILQSCYGHQEDDSDSDEAASVERELVCGASGGWQPWVAPTSDKYMAGQCSNSIRTSFNNLSVNNALCTDKFANASASNADVPSNQNSDDASRNRTFYFASNNLSDPSCASTSKGIEPVNSNFKFKKSSEQPIMFDGRGFFSQSCTKSPGTMEKHSKCSQYLPNVNKMVANESPGALSAAHGTMSTETPGTSSSTNYKSSSKSPSDESNLGASGKSRDLGSKFNEEDSEMSSSSEDEADDSRLLKDSEQHLRVVVFRKAVLMVLKAIAVTVKEARGDGASSSSSSENSSPRSRGGDSETEEMDMAIIGKSLKEVLARLDEFVKRRECYHPHCLVAEWLVKLFSAQDDWMVEAMVCGLDIYSGLGHSVSGVSAQVAAWLCPHTSFLVFIDTVRYDYSVLLDLLVSNETCFLLYLLRYLKVTKRSWSSLQSVASTDGANMHLAMETMQQLHDSINKLVAKELFPYDITPVLRLLNHCQQLFSASTR